MKEDTIGRERFCPRAESWVATWGPNERPADRCAECGELDACHFRQAARSRERSNEPFTRYMCRDI